MMRSVEADAGQPAEDGRVVVALAEERLEPRDHALDVRKWT
jgi:hypothetical protein